MLDPCSAPWHRESYERFLKERLPAMLASRLPLAHYRAEPAAVNAWTVAVAVRSNGAEIATVFENLPGPDQDGFILQGKERRVVVPVATAADLAEAEFLCVGEQLERLLESRLGEAPANLRWDEPLLHNWVGLDETLRAFLSGELNREIESLFGWRIGPNFGWQTVQVPDDTNWLAEKTHLRRIAVPKRKPEVLSVMPRRTDLVHPSERGRTCPFETPEGVNIGRILSLARGAAIRDRKLVIVDDSPAAGLGLTASMVPLLEHSDANRLLMGVNMMRQWLPRPEPEPALVQTGHEPHAPGFWCGRNLLTAFVSWGAAAFEDGIVVSASAARRLAVDAPLEAGDKLSNRHGSKGVVGAIFPDGEMPHLEDGTPVELVFSFIGLHTRMNFGQVREALLGRIAAREGQPVISPPFQGLSDEQLKQRLTAAGFSETGMEVLRDGAKGERLSRPSTVGQVYWGLTHHLAREKLDTTPQTASFLQYQVLRDAGAVETILEQYGTQNVGVKREKLEQALAAGQVEQAQPPSPAFVHLQRALGMAGIGAELRDGHVHFALLDPPSAALPLPSRVTHTWLPERRLTHIRVPHETPQGKALAEAQAHVRRLLDNGSPQSLVERAEQNVQAALDKLLNSLLRPEHLQLTSQVAFSGRAVIAPGLGLRTDQCGLPEELAWHLFGPLVAREAGADAASAHSAQAAKALDQIMAESWVLVSREPVVLPTSVLAFHPERTPEFAIRLHPLVCAPMNADFDGDQVGVCLPVTAAGQREAGARLTLAAHLSRHPEMLRWMLPCNEALWGLAWLACDAAGRAQVAAAAGCDPAGGDGLVTRNSLLRAMERVLAEAGPERTLARLQALLALGFEAARRSGASLNPFAHRSMPRPVTPEPLTFETARVCRDNLVDVLVSRTDYDALDVGPQLLAVKTGSRGMPHQLTMGLICRTIADYEGRLKHFNESLLGGLSVEAVYASSIGARVGLAEVCVQSSGSERRAYGLPDPAGPEGYHVLARAMRSPTPGVVFARAAAAGEVDPLVDADSRLFVGLRPA